MWWKVLKDAKIRSKGKTGSALDTSRLKVNVEDNSCKKDFRVWAGKQKNFKEIAFIFPIEAELTQLVEKNAGYGVTEKEFCELIDYLKQSLANESGLSMASKHIFDSNSWDGTRTHGHITLFESSKRNIKIVFFVKLNKTVNLTMALVCRTEHGIMDLSIQRNISFKVEDYFDGKNIKNYLREVMFKWN